MLITKQELIELNACKEGLERFIFQTSNTDAAVEVSSLVGGENTYSDLLWLAGKKLPKERIVRFACDCALINIELIKPYTDKYDVIVEFLQTPSATAVSDCAAYAAAYAAYAAADADADAASAAYAAARAAYASVVVPASYAADAADAAAHAADAGSREKVDELLVKLFE